jgi:hypothetical protein
MPWFIVGRPVAVACLVALVLLAGCGQNARTTKKGENVLHTTASLEQIRVAVGRVAMDRGLKTFQSERKTTSVNDVESRSGKYTLPDVDGGEIVVEAIPEDGGYTVTTSGEPSLASKTTDSLIELIAKKK